MRVAPSQNSVTTALRTVLFAMLPAGTDVVLGQANRVPEPASINFVVMTPTHRRRLATNVDGLNDCRFVGSASGEVLTVVEVTFGVVTPGHVLFGTGVPNGVTITDQLSGPTGGAGTYQLSAAVTAAPGSVLASGALDVTGPYELTVQLDFHGAGGDTQSADNAQIVSTLLRDDWAVQQFAALNPAVTPLHADEPKQIPFVNGEGQFEDRWIVEAVLQVDETISVPQQYMDAAHVGIVNVDAKYPP